MLLSLLIGALCVPAALGFSFTFDRDPTQCGVVNVRWEGGSPPFRLTIIPAFDYPANITLPESTWTVSSQSGSYAWTVNYPAGTQFTALMSDSTGTGTGGVSPLYRVAAAEGSSACTLRAEENDFLFYLNATSVNQCDMVNVYWDDTAVDPVVILGVIPGGQIFQLWSATDSNSLLWNTNIAAGTEFILAAFNNGPRGTGGSSQLFTVGPGNNYCLSEDSPSSTTGTRTSTRTGTNTGAVRTITAITTARPAGAAGLSTGAIVGIAISAVVVVLALQAALLWFCCRRQLMALISHRRQMKEERQVKPGSVDLLADPEHEGGDHPTSLHEAQRRNSLANRLSLTSRSRGGETLANRSSTDDTLDMQSISPFWDTHSPVTRNSGLGNGPFEFPPEDADLALPPVAPFGRQDRGHSRDSSLGTYSISSNQPLTLSTDVSPFPSMNFSPVSPDLATLQVNNTSHPRLPGIGNQPQTKAQMAAALSTANPDRVPSPGSSQPRNNQAAGFGSRLPRHEAPSGGFRRHEDAGRIPLDDEDDEDSPQDREPPPEVEELPPLYKPEWESESNGRNSGLGLGTTGSTASLGMSSRLPPGAAPR